MSNGFLHQSVGRKIFYFTKLHKIFGVAQFSDGRSAIGTKQLFCLGLDSNQHNVINVCPWFAASSPIERVHSAQGNAWLVASIMYVHSQELVDFSSQHNVCP